MKITREEAENLMNMLLSPDKDNAYLAFKAINAHEYAIEDIGYLIYFFKFSKFAVDDWKTEAPNAYTILLNHLDLTTVLTYGKALNTMINLKVDKDAIQLLLNRHVIELTKMLGDMGYPVEKLDFNLKLKE